jgi:AraC family transcriptional regulator of adaptative response / DNA-3-methyladenine glycosylase II
MVRAMLPDTEHLWQAIEARDPRLDGWLFVGVRTTGIYCRPSCRARMPQPENVRLFSSAAAAQAAGFRGASDAVPTWCPAHPSGTGALTWSAGRCG